ncbi:hypothetical protein C8A00DRAFT_41381 [Chaetomidium leptoderma]|uniref:Lipoprotein n=1 Tax=Chaetomidium leptoderma TaxID=669021 RepID=A0AAN6ZZP8_9PEZI|nr:hypothetical protein C8A00DRAFT_41381 [Chaetomidium leptoderma]
MGRIMEASLYCLGAIYFPAQWIRVAFTTVALLAGCGAVQTIPTAAAVGSPFSFVEWVEQMIADPEGHHLTPEQATAAFYANQDSASPSEHGTRGLLGKRVPRCNEIVNTEAWVPHAVACINELARRGGDCRVQFSTRFCISGTAEINGNSGWDTTSSCNDVARGAGYIMDHCTRADNTVQGSEYAHGNGILLVRIHRVGV